MRQKANQLRGITPHFLQAVAADALGLADAPEDWAQLRRIARTVQPWARRFANAQAQRRGIDAALERGASALAVEPTARLVFLRFAHNAMAAAKECC